MALPRREAKLTDGNPSEAYEAVRSEPGPVPPQGVDMPFLVPASELRNRKMKRRRKKLDPPRAKKEAGAANG